MVDENPYAAPQTDVHVQIADGDAALATRGQRFIAAILDSLIMLAVVIPIMILLAFSGIFTLESMATMGIVETLIIGVISFIAYILINWLPLQEGQTWGKRIQKIRVVMRDGSQISAGRYITHRLLPIQAAASIPVVGNLIALADVLLIFRSGKNTLHDDIAGTKVIAINQAVNPAAAGVS